MISLNFWQRDSSYTLVMFGICAFMFSLILLTNGQHWHFSIFWRFLVYSVSCQKTIFAAGRHPEQTMRAIKAPTRRPKRFYKELVTSFELLPKVDGPELKSVNPYLFYDFSISGWPDFWRPEREITTRRQSHRCRGRPRRGNQDFPSQSLSSLKYTFFI